MTHKSVRKLVVLGVDTAIALTLFVLEAQIPVLIAIPGMKLGLSNVVTLLVLTRYRPRDALCVLLVRIVLGSLFCGQMVSFLYSLVGGLLCFLAMWGCSSLLHRRYLWFTSVIGAVCHNAGQLAVAAVLLGSRQVWIYAPFLLVSGCLTGWFTGMAATFVLAALRAHEAAKKSSHPSQ